MSEQLEQDLIRHASNVGESTEIGMDLLAAAEVIQSLRAKLATVRDDTPTPEEIAAAWKAWHSRHGGKLGPGPAFREAIEAAFKCRAMKGKSE